MKREGEDVLQKRLPHLRAALEHARQLSGRQLQQHAEGLRLRPLAALHKPLPHLGILPHLQEENKPMYDHIGRVNSEGHFRDFNRGSYGHGKRGKVMEFLNVYF